MNEALTLFNITSGLNDYAKARFIFTFMLSTEYTIVDKKIRNSLITINNRYGKGKRRYRTKIHGDLYTVVLEYIPNTQGQVETDKERTG